MNYKTIIQLARDLRKNQTPAEKVLWNILRNRRFEGKKFLRQHPVIYEFHKNNPIFIIADFYCAEEKFIIEVDGSVHDYQQDYDEQRDWIADEMGLKVLRIKNEELDDIESVKIKIRKMFNKK